MSSKNITKVVSTIQIQSPKRKDQISMTSPRDLEILSNLKISNDNYSKGRLFVNLENKFKHENIKREAFSASKQLVKASKDNKKLMLINQTKLPNKIKQFAFIDYYTQFQSNAKKKVIMKNEDFGLKNNLILTTNSTLFNNSTKDNYNEETKISTFITEKIDFSKIEKNVFKDKVDLNNIDRSKIKFSGRYNQELLMLNKDKLLPRKKIINFNTTSSMKKGILHSPFKVKNNELTKKTQNSLVIISNQMNESIKGTQGFSKKSRVLMNTVNSSKLIKSRIHRKSENESNLTELKIRPVSSYTTITSSHRQFSLKKEKLFHFDFVRSKIPKNNFMNRDDESHKKRKIKLNSFNSHF